jgi:hypothetical protein
MICLWTFNAEDFADWCHLVGSPEVASYANYLTLLAAVQADCERSGHAVRRVCISVAEMRRRLHAGRLENTPDNRAQVLATSMETE